MIIVSWKKIVLKHSSVDNRCHHYMREKYEIHSGTCSYD